MSRFEIIDVSPSETLPLPPELDGCELCGHCTIIRALFKHRASLKAGRELSAEDIKELGFIPRSCATTGLPETSGAEVPTSTPNR